MCHLVWCDYVIRNRPRTNMHSQPLNRFEKILYTAQSAIFCMQSRIQLASTQFNLCILQFNQLRLHQQFSPINDDELVYIFFMQSSILCEQFYSVSIKPMVGALTAAYEARGFARLLQFLTGRNHYWHRISFMANKVLHSKKFII